MKKNRIIIADDSPVIQSLTKKILQAQGFEVKGSKTGSPVPELLKAHNADLLILDILLPDINGLDVARKLRSSADKHLSSIPIIAISGNAEDYSKDDLESAGINNFLLKPINYDDLLASIKDLLDNDD